MGMGGVMQLGKSHSGNFNIDSARIHGLNQPDKVIGWGMTATLSSYCFKLLYGTEPGNTVSLCDGNRATPHITNSGLCAVTNTWWSQDRSFALKGVERLQVQFKKNQNHNLMIVQVEKLTATKEGSATIAMKRRLETHATKEWFFFVPSVTQCHHVALRGSFGPHPVTF